MIRVVISVCLVLAVETASGQNRKMFGPSAQPKLPKNCPIVIDLDNVTWIDLKALFPDVKQVRFHYNAKGKLDGLQAEVVAKGGQLTPVWTGSFRMGIRVGRHTLFDKDGSPLATIEYRKGKRHGLAVLLFDGWPAFAATFDMGRLRKAWVVTYKAGGANVAEITPGSLLDELLPLLKPQLDAWELVMIEGNRRLARLARDYWHEDVRAYLTKVIPERRRRLSELRRQRAAENQRNFSDMIEQQRRDLLWPHGY